jgi:hypothetical protein
MAVFHKGDSGSDALARAHDANPYKIKQKYAQGYALVFTPAQQEGSAAAVLARGWIQGEARGLKGPVGGDTEFIGYVVDRRQIVLGSCSHWATFCFTLEVQG